MRFVLISTHIDQMTGYAKVVTNLIQQIATVPDVKVFHFGFQRHPSRPGIRTAPKGVIQYDAAANEEPREEGFGFNKIVEYLETVNPDVVMIYNDPMIIYKFIETMKYEKGKSSFKLWIYLDLVYKGTVKPLIDKINECADRVYMFSDTWVREYSSYGSTPTMSIMEHAVDSTVFSKLDRHTRSSIRMSMNIPTNAIIFLNANRNSQRKRIDLSIMAFVDLVARDVKKPYFMMIVTAATPQGGGHYDLTRIFTTELAARDMSVEKFGNRMIIVDSAATPLSDSKINEIYNITDIGINTSDGEGFGLCQLEHLYTGAPQVVTDVGAYSTFLTPEVAEFVPSIGYSYFPGSMPIGLQCPYFDYKMVANAMEKTIDTLDERREAARTYSFKTWKEVCANWLTDIRNECT
jgi:glycosyltransferase involved in cell wall biosynthesis